MTTESFQLQVQKLLFNNSTSSGACREKLAAKISSLREEMAGVRPLMDRTEIYALGQSLFGRAMIHAESIGETVMEDGRDEHYWAHASGYDLIRAASSYFEEAEL